MTPEEQKELQKAAIKEAIQEWLDKQFATVGRWTVRGIVSAGLAVLFYLYAASHGWIIKL